MTDLEFEREMIEYIKEETYNEPKTRLAIENVMWYITPFLYVLKPEKSVVFLRVLGRYCTSLAERFEQKNKSNLN